MAKEIERKFLVRNDRWRQHVTSETRLRQAYVASEDDRSVRIRTRDTSSAQITIKFGGSSLVRDEYEYQIPYEDAAEIINFAIGNVIEKTRYTVEYRGFTWEVDVFDGAYTGLVIAEVELSSAEDKPDLPDWIGREVTGDKRYSNQILATQRLKPELVHVISH
ncbi:CYTH domain-containing protein [Peteryoungia desertarenae]|uniref:CYTH domain-containing protein n=1 Tax=Peteryoungia desertarenae TaxID=1813451 RepID=A0ABX6QHY6_9HYPH|nr:CYTH domain-containing protein [Peteryoungia desertarenae]QLF68174.1 CYTH domain-containing protein [Peteryoungia desertarenae]